jgi:succinate dehydrogenase / fumarate reductase flavoprotein subunit
MHGANRLGGNSLSDLIVFGHLAGVGAHEYVKGLSSRPACSDADVDNARKEAVAPLNREKGENPYLLHEALQDVMHENVNIVRTGDELKTAVTEIGKLWERATQVKAHGASQYNPGWHEALSMRSLLLTAEAVTKAALVREESRGAHTRNDFPGEREEWGRRLVVVRKGKDGRLETEIEERKAGPDELVTIANATLEDLEGKQ